MKRTSIRILLAALVIMIVAACTAFADGSGLELVESYPKDQQKNTSVENLSVKLTFNNPVTAKANQDANDKCFSLTDAEGTSLPIKVYYNPKNDKEVLVLFDTDSGQAISSNSEYTFKISGDFTDDQGNTLGADKTLTFTTLNQKLNTSIYMIMMVVMMGGMFFFSSRQARKQQQEGAGAAGNVPAKDAPFNPYKEAKRTGKSVAEVMAEHNREVEKQAAKEARKNAKKVETEEEEEEMTFPGRYRVHGPRPIAAAGAKYVTGRKAIAEAKKAEEERLAKRRAANQKKKKK
ncbi:MAG: Ig-like domain-containing protein [Eubacterium sp.]|nr:Ig-like domain-containing protein [Eubacterium sp.]